MSEDRQAMPRLKRAAKRLCDAVDRLGMAVDDYSDTDDHSDRLERADAVTEATLELGDARDAVRALLA